MITFVNYDYELALKRNSAIFAIRYMKPMNVDGAFMSQPGFTDECSLIKGV